MGDILTLHTRHDANLTVSRGNKIKLYLELEKIAKQRYFSFSVREEKFKEEFKEYAMPFLKKYKISTIALCWATPTQVRVLKRLFPKVLDWRYTHHHIAHAWSAYLFTKPEENDLIVSYDGGGDLEDYFKVFSYKFGKITLLLDAKINLGKPYRLLGLLSPELYRDRDKGYVLNLPLSGKKMALAALGKVNKDYIPPLNKFYENFELVPLEEGFRLLLDELGFKGKKFLPKSEARDMLATSQFILESNFKKYVYPFLKGGAYKRLILVGGCALNVTMNSKVYKDFKIPVFIPPCPNDCGISLGMQKMLYPSMNRLKSPFFNIPPSDPGFMQSVKAGIRSKSISVKQFAKSLATGRIIGTLTGPLEIGPRALGNRSYLASPLIKGMKNRVNMLKGREYWRPVAPIVLSEDLNKYFESSPESPYMSFAPKIKKNYKALLREIAHYDGSARIQTVDKNDGGVYKLLKEFKRVTGVGVLMNTSFNKKGEPLINDFRDAFEILKTTNLDGVYRKGVLYEKG